MDRARRHRKAPVTPAAQHGLTANPARRNRARLIVAVCALALVAFRLAPALRADPAGDPAALRFGFSSLVFGEVNENDARASLKVWSKTLGAERGVPVNPAVQILTDLRDIRNALQRQEVDAVTITTEEFWILRRSVPLGPIILGRPNGEVTEEYLLLVHRDHPAARLADLRGQRVAFLTTSRASLAPVWIETLLLEENLGLAENFWGTVARSAKLSRVILPVFFRQVDACVVTRAGFRTMTELNPQVGLQLKILAQSPPLVPDLFCFRSDLVSPHRDALMEGAARIAETPAGRQTLMLFQSELIAVRPLSDLDSALTLLDRHALLSAAAQDAAATPASVAPTALAKGTGK